ncbi:terpene synthase family protein [Amycolatopsis sp. NPDC001319]|uniref:terpene synthase family protein n=1 Tax=unclassified Amycolatopsis TaxID=2618356 RepID=UPI0036767EE6
MQGLTSYAETAIPGVVLPETLRDTRRWAGRFDADTERISRYVTLFAWVHPDIVAQQQSILAKIYAFYRFYDDFNDSLQNDIATSRSIAEEMIGVLNDEEPRSDTSVVCMFRDLWRQHKKTAPQSFLSRTATHWRHYFATQSNYHAMRKDEYPWNLEDYLGFRIDNGGVALAITQGELANTVYIPDPVYRMRTLVRMRTLASYCIILTNDLHSAVRDERIGDHRNPVAQYIRHAGASRAEAFAYVQNLLLTYSEQLHDSFDRLALECDLLELGDAECAVAQTAARNCVHHSDGYEAWAYRNEPRLAAPDVDPGLIIRPSGS